MASCAGFGPEKPLLTGSCRLEAATSRLEDMVPNTTDAAAPTNGTQAGQFQSPTNNRAIEQAGVVAPTPLQHREALPPAIDDFDAMINAEVKTFVNMSEEIGGLVAEQVWIESFLARGGPLSDSSIYLGCRSPALFRRRTQIPHHYNQGQEARYTIAHLHGDIERASVYDGVCQ